MDAWAQLPAALLPAVVAFPLPALCTALQGSLQPAQLHSVSHRLVRGPRPLSLGLTWL